MINLTEHAVLRFCHRFGVPCEETARWVLAELLVDARPAGRALGHAHLLHAYYGPDRVGLVVRQAQLVTVLSQGRGPRRPPRRAARDDTSATRDLA